MSGLTLRPDQRADVARFLAGLGQQHYRGGLNASIVGGGKTAVGVEAARCATPDGVKLITAPLNTFDGWERTVRMLADQPLRWVQSANSQEIVDLYDRKPGWYFGTWEYMRTLDVGQDFRPDFLLLDEIHRLANPKSLNYRTLQHAAYMTKLYDGWVMGLSATPYGNFPAGAFGVCSTLWPHDKDRRYDYFWPFVDRYIGKQRNSFNGVIEPRRTEKAPGVIAANMPLYWRHEMGVQCCQFHPRGIQEHLPPRLIRRVKVDLTSTQRKLYDTLKKDMIAWMRDHDLPITGEFPPVMNLRLRQICLAVPYPELAMRLKTDTKTGDKEWVQYTTLKYAEETKGSKLDAVMEIVTDLPQGERVLILSHSAGIITPILYRMHKAGINAQRWDGSMSGNARQGIKDSFIKGSPQNGGDGSGVQVIVAQIGAIGEGVDGLQWACSNDIWLSKDYNNLLNTQAYGRLLRDGQTRTVNTWSIEARDTIEEDQLADLDEQTQVMHGALGVH
jgi:superfamily II DNA or RNA helicase